MAPFLRHRGIDTIDYLVVSHPDGDHLGGLPAVISALPVGVVIEGGSAGRGAIYDRFRFLTDSLGVRRLRLSAGDVVGRDLPARVYVLGPDRFSPAGSGNTNESSVVLLVRFGTTSVIFPGDAEGGLEGALVARYGPFLDSDIHTTELEPEGTGETFDAGDLMVGFSYARRLTEDFSVGVTAKYVYRSIWRESASGIAFDVGTQFRLGFRDLTLAMSMTNFGPDIQYEGDDLNVKYDPSSQFPMNRLSPASLSTEAYHLPLYFQVGVAMTVVETDAFSALLAADFAHPNDNQERVNIGAELTVVKYVALRAGYRFGYDVESLALGAGVQIPLGGTALQFDYAFAFHDLLPDIHRISLGFGF